MMLFRVDWFVCQFDSLAFKERDCLRAAEAFRRNSMRLEAKLERKVRGKMWRWRGCLVAGIGECIFVGRRDY